MYCSQSPTVVYLDLTSHPERTGPAQRVGHVKCADIFARPHVYVKRQPVSTDLPFCAYTLVSDVQKFVAGYSNLGMRASTLATYCWVCGKTPYFARFIGPS